MKVRAGEAGKPSVANDAIRTSRDGVPPLRREPPVPRPEAHSTGPQRTALLRSPTRHYRQRSSCPRRLSLTGLGVGVSASPLGAALVAGLVWAAVSPPEGRF